VLPDATVGGGRSALGDSDLQTREDMMKSCKEKCLEGLRRCTRASRRDVYQKWVAGSPGCARIVLARRQCCRSPATNCDGLATL
jgi:hypothetical protein